MSPKCLSVWKLDFEWTTWRCQNDFFFIYFFYFARRTTNLLSSVELVFFWFYILFFFFFFSTIRYICVNRFQGEWIVKRKWESCKTFELLFLSKWVIIVRIYQIPCLNLEIKAGNIWLLMPKFLVSNDLLFSHEENFSMNRWMIKRWYEYYYWWYSFFFSKATCNGNIHRSTIMNNCSRKAISSDRMVMFIIQKWKIRKFCSWW